MTLTKKEQDEILKDGGRIPPAVIALVWILKPAIWLLTRIGVVRRAIGQTAGARFGVISRLQKRGDHNKAVDLAIDALRTHRHRMRELFDTGIPHFKWWWFMRQAVFSLRHCDDAERWETVIALARDGPEPFEGFEVAYAFYHFARHKMAQRDYVAAVDFATIAARADASWGEPDFLLGWYELAIGGGDAYAHLSRAVRKDSGILFRIASDSVCARHPHVIARLKELSRKGLVSAGDKPAPAED